MAPHNEPMQSEAQKKEFEAVTFAENEVYGIDILISSGEDGKVKEEPDGLGLAGEGTVRESTLRGVGRVPPEESEETDLRDV